MPTDCFDCGDGPCYMNCGPVVERCPSCGGLLSWKHDHRPDNSGLDDGPYLPGQAPRKKSAPKPAEEITEIRTRAWATQSREVWQIWTWNYAVFLMISLAISSCASEPKENHQAIWNAALSGTMRP